MEALHRLYLSKNSEGKKLVYIDNCKVPQHHIDGIRSLYRVFKKNKSGAILNDPVGFNKEVQIVLFLKAVGHLLDKTILVLCPEGTEDDWLQLFRTWTDLGDDVVIETAKPYIKKKVIINSMVNLPFFSQQAWSVVVVTDDSPPNTVLRYTFRADFKIWNTSVNIKKNLSIFQSIYTWLNQDKMKSNNSVKKFNISDFTPDRKNVRDVIDKAVRLDAFMEDIVIRRNKIDSNGEEIKNFPTPKVSKKNKDASGTKIKRSKRKILDEATVIKDKGIESTDPKIPKPNEVGKEDITDPTFILEPVSSANLQEQVEEIKNLVLSQDIKLVYETDTMTENDMIYEINTLVDDTTTTIKDNNKEHNLMECDSVKEESKSNEVNEVLNSNDSECRVADIVVQPQDEQIKSDVVSMEVSEEIEKSDSTQHTQELVTEITENQSIIESEKSNDIMESENDITVANNEIIDDQTITNVSNNGNKINESTDVKEDLDDFDLKNNQIKEQAMKRFRGSVLDTIF